MNLLKKIYQYWLVCSKVKAQNQMNHICYFTKGWKGHFATNLSSNNNNKFKLSLKENFECDFSQLFVKYVKPCPQKPDQLCS
jgi:hypothetical protein